VIGAYLKKKRCGEKK